MVVVSIDLVAAHMAGDYLFQTSWMATKKTAWTAEGWVACLVHSVVYTACFVPLFVMGGLGWQRGAWAFLFVWALHFITDKRRWASAEGWAPRPILVDQALHAVQLALLWHLFLAPGGA